MSNWSKVNTFVDDAGRTIHRHDVVSGPDKGQQTFTGSFVLGLKSPNPAIPPQQVSLSFDFPDGSTFDKAVATFDELAKKAVGEFEERRNKMIAEQSRSIITARQGKKLLDASGKVIGG